MMLATGILMLYITGAALLLRISKKICWKEIISYSLPLGFATNTFIMLICDIIGFRFTGIVLFFGSFAIVALNYDLLYSYYQKNKQHIRLPELDPKKINYLAAFLSILMLILFYVITSKNLYWPTFENDAIGSFDKLGQIMAYEGRIKISLFEYGLQGSGGIYPPLFHGGIAYLYSFGSTSPKIITTLYYVSLILGFYSVTKKYVSVSIALFFTLIMMITPELYSHASLLLSNLPTTTNVSIAALSLFLWIDKGEKEYLRLSAIFMALVLWTRNDAIGFAVAGALVVAFISVRKKDFRTAGYYALTAFSTIFIWTAYLKFKIAIPQTSRFVDHIGFDYDKFMTMSYYVISMFSWLQYRTMSPGYMLYGLSFLLPFLFIILNIKYLHQDRKWVLLFFVISFLTYFLVFYFIDEEKQQAPIWSLMESSFKRGMFCFAPVLLFYAATNKKAIWVSEMLEKFRLGK